MYFRTDFYLSIDNELNTILETELLSNGPNAMNNISKDIKFLTKRPYNSPEELDREIIRLIAINLENLENSIIKKLKEVQKFYELKFNQTFQAKEFLIQAKRMAIELSSQLYSKDNLHYLRHYHEVYLTMIYCEDALKELRITDTRDIYSKINDKQREYAKKSEDRIRENSKNWTTEF